MSLTDRVVHFVRLVTGREANEADARNAAAHRRLRCVLDEDMKEIDRLMNGGGDAPKPNGGSNGHHP